MSGAFLKGLIPGVVVVAAVTALALTQTGSAATASLSTSASAAIAGPDFDWARVTVDGRDAILTGTATTQKMIDDAAARVAATHGIRTVLSEVSLAERLSPYVFTGTVQGGAVEIGGGYPDDSVHAELVAAIAGAKDGTRLYSGAPAGFESAAKYGLAALSQMDDGAIRLADLDLSITGRAKSAAAYDTLQQLSEQVPAGLHVAAMTIEPPVASPYVWTANFDGTAVTITGNAPNAALADKLRALAPANVPVRTSLVPASGEPSGFEAKTLALLGSLLTLEQGEASISGTTITLVGAPASAQIADTARTALTRLGGTADLEPPRVAEFALDIDKAGGKLVFSGFVPDAPTKAKLAALAGADISALKLGRGAPERFASALDFGLDALGHLESGKVGLKGDRVSIGGRAATSADYKAASGLVAQGAPQGVSLAAVEVRPPLADPFVWSADKAPSGTMTLSGLVPDDATRAVLAARAGTAAVDSTELADGAPRDFAALAGKGLDVLALLDSGTLKFDGKGWSIEGNVDSAKKGFAADAAYSVSGLRTAGWTYAVHQPEPAALPIIAPYVWRAQKAADGTVSFSGFVPSEDLKSALAAHATGAADATTLGAGAPADFEAAMSAGLDALLALDDGALSLSGQKWTLTGTIASAARRDAIQTTLGARTDAANWQVAIQARDAAPVVSPYLWSATKSADGSVSLSGYLPSPALKSFAAVRAGQNVDDTTTIASGAPAGFTDDVLAALDALAHLREGRTGFDGGKWRLSGSVASPADGDAAVAALATGSNGGALWETDIAGYPPASSSSAEPSSSASSTVSAPDITSLAPSSDVAVQSSEASSASSLEPSTSSVEMSSSSSETSSASAEISSSSAESSSSVSQESPRDVAPTTLETLPPMPETLVFEASRKPGGSIVLQGAVPDEATAAAFGTAAGGSKTDKLTTREGLPADFAASGNAGLAALAELSSGRVGFDGTHWWLRGKAEQEAAEDDATSRIAALPNGRDWSVGIDLLAPLDVCRLRASALAGRNAIVFQAGKATLMASSMPVLDELAGDLQLCPNTFVHVQGHTDADGDADTNLALSVARAEAVVAELVKRGVDEARFYAEGYGESDPVASNDTKDGKARNRRIEFQISEK